MSRGRRKKPTSAVPGPRRKSAFLALLAGVGLLAGGFAFVSTEGDAPPWNVVLISIDTLRADHVSAYGGPVETPHIDRLAREGVLFETAQTVAPTTLPAHASLFTGRRPPRHGVHDNTGFYLEDGTATLASHLRAQGYRTGGFVGAFVLDSRFGIAQGFDEYYDDFDALTDDVAGGFVSQRSGEDVIAKATAWLDSVREEPAPFFAFVHLYEPHTPYEPPAAFRRGESPSDRYRGEVAYADSLVGKLLAWLDEHGLEDRTLVALTADHGESLGEHGERTHGFFIYESSLHVPLILSYPDVSAGSRVSALVRLIDVAPTILDALEVPPLDGADGTSLVPLVRDPERAWDETAYAETYFPRIHYGWSELRSLREGDHKLILAPTPELYDLARDPTESRNLYGQEPEIARRLRDALGEAPAFEVSSVDSETRARLESLGYVGSAPSRPSLADPKDRIELYDALNDPALKSVEPSDGAAFGAALALLDQALVEEPTIPRAYVLYGELLLKAGRAKDAATIFGRLVSLDPGFEGFYGLGMARQRLGELDAAEEAYRRALAVEPRNTKSHYRLSELEAARGNLEAAETWLREAIELSPNRVLQQRLAVVMLGAGRREEARALFDRIAREHGADAIALYNLGQSLLVEGNPESALEVFRRAATLSPDDADVHQGVGNALLTTGQLEPAVDAFRRAIELSPCFAGAHANLGLALVKLGRVGDGIASMEKALSCDPSYILGYKNLAAVQLEAGDLSGAIQTLRRASEHAPDNAELERLLEELIAFEKRNR